jgi:hypothetical protein
MESVACELQRIEGWTVAMSNNYWDEDEDDIDTDIESSGDGTDLLKKLRKAKRADEKRIKELEEKVNSFSKIENERSVKSILEKQGVNPKAARLILKDLDEVNENTVNDWLVENGDLFGIEVSKDAPAVSDETRQAIRQQDSITQGAKTPDRGEDLELRIDQATSPEELNRILFSQ